MNTTILCAKILTLCVLLITEIDCGYPPLVSGAYLDLTEKIGTKLHDVVTYTCVKGKWVKREVYSINLTCSSDAAWKRTSNHCTGTQHQCCCGRGDYIERYSIVGYQQDASRNMH